MKLFFLGAPGAGKGTQTEILSKRLNIPAISTGSILRAAVKNNTPVGAKAQTYMAAGQLVPDEIVIDIIRERLIEPDCAEGFILDGVPRTITQAETLEQAGIEFDHVVSIEVSDEVIMERMSGRCVCEQCGATYHIVSIPPKKEGICDRCGGHLIRRKDDEPETVQHRLEIYHRETEPLKGFYAKRGALRTVETSGDVEENTCKILDLIFC